MYYTILSLRSFRFFFFRYASCGTRNLLVFQMSPHDDPRVYNNSGLFLQDDHHDSDSDSALEDEFPALTDVFADESMTDDDFDGDDQGLPELIVDDDDVPPPLRTDTATVPTLDEGVGSPCSFAFGQQDTDGPLLFEPHLVPQGNPAVGAVLHNAYVQAINLSVQNMVDTHVIVPSEAAWDAPLFYVGGESPPPSPV